MTQTPKRGGPFEAGDQVHLAGQPIRLTYLGPSKGQVDSADVCWYEPADGKFKYASFPNSALQVGDPWCDIHTMIGISLRRR